MNITVGILTWNGLEHTKKCIESLRAIEPNGIMDVLVWDNNSTDGTVKYLESLDNRNYFINFSNENAGMTKPWNWFLNRAFDGHLKSDCCFVCNNDIVFSKQINNIFPFMRENPEFGLVCPYELPKKLRDNHDFSTHYELIEEECQKYSDANLNNIDIGNLWGPCMIVTEPCYRVVGPFDENLPMSFNDMDYHQRVLKAGYGTVVHHGCPIFHYGGVSTKHIPKEVSQQQYELFQRKHG